MTKKAINTVLTKQDKERFESFGIVAEAAQQAAFEVPQLLKKTHASTWKLGQKLSKVKEEIATHSSPELSGKQMKDLARGRWLNYLKNYVHIREMTANRHIDVYNAWPKYQDFMQYMATHPDATFREIYDEAAKAKRTKKGQAKQERQKRIDKVKKIEAFDNILQEWDLPTDDDERQELATALRSLLNTVEDHLTRLEPKQKSLKKAA